MSGQWLPITEYSTKYRISVSTLRRRIKTNDIKYQFIDGKYLLLDEPANTHQHRRPSLNSELKVNPKADSGTRDEDLEPPQPPSGGTEGPILTAANKLLTELKKAYSQILQEKEEQILQLREEVADLKTLVRVLESQNEGLKARLVSPRDGIRV